MLRDVTLEFSDQYVLKDQTLRRFKVEMQLVDQPVMASAGDGAAGAQR